MKKNDEKILLHLHLNRVFIEMMSEVLVLMMKTDVAKGNCALRKVHTRLN